MKKPCIVIACIAVLFGCNLRQQPAGDVNIERIIQADEEPENWMSLGRNFMQHHHSPLSQINKDNIKSLGFAWQYETNSNRGKVNRGLEATPIVVDGVLYTSGAWSQVYAVNAKTGKEIWRYDPGVDGNYARRTCCDVINRGIQVWQGKVFIGTLDGYLIALDAATGKELWKQDTFVDREAFYTITGPPQIAKGKVVIGNAGADFGVRGYITAYDLETGDFAWRFFTVPADSTHKQADEAMKIAVPTWDANSLWQAGGGGTVWGELAYDPHLNLLYVGTGNGSPYPLWIRSPSGGENLFLSSILAIDPDDGRLVWYYQTSPGESWDHTSTANIVLADLSINGKTRKVLMQAPKNGFFYVIDRVTGKLISAEKYVPVNWADSVDTRTGKPSISNQAWYKDSPRYIFPGPVGGHSWQPMSYNPNTGLVYIPTHDIPFVYSELPGYQFAPRNINSGVITNAVPLPEHLKIYAEGWPAHEGDVLKAWDPVKQKEVWRVHLPSRFNGGVLSTSGDLVFQGTSSGYLNIYKADTGEKLNEIYTGTGMLAAPVTYTVDGEQYVAVMAGFGGSFLPIPNGATALNKYKNTGRIIAFKLGGGETPLPLPQDRVTKVPAPPDAVLEESQIRRGEDLYNQFCARCHTTMGEEHLSEIPDLSLLPKHLHDDFINIVLHGKLSFYGMAGFSDVLSQEDANAIHQFIISMQKHRYERQNTGNEIR
ncbi:PQQ-dependent dehydrogenase, methanol/ethanol family [Chryseosolibacter indicus]|uniref:PQQ-dependent dehydrogenase, methanol/ethanol family n=1 Tax=Chryseosolibacter indicus TaxID=2782351 RepID=A0ABS5VRI2_9BACT|nr:PQQ-dependent dehydrogenase, methanol/ethanol family [Chryseosolibacter indicus]MBT1704053.1 PQQ-dependent dehydrogenase, methanol/ethanol family [Chryseosolibacter indicus]